MRRESQVKLVGAANNNLVPATLIVGLTIEEVDAAFAEWSPYLQLKLTRGVHAPEHAHWRWDQKARAAQELPSYMLCGISVEGDELQALMLRSDALPTAKHPDQRGQGIVYIDFLSAAPLNDPHINTRPIYRGCGTILVREAVEHSVSLGFKGRLALYSLPQAEDFYRTRCGMIDLGPDLEAEHQGLQYFEFTPDTAEQFLARTGKRGTY